MARTPRVAIIGGGNAGLAAALALHRRGVEVTVYEQAGQLSGQQDAEAADLKKLEQQRQRLNNPVYIEQLARDRLHMCLPGANCYVIIGGQAAGRSSAGSAAASTPWYERLWHSVRQADQGPVHE